MLSLVDLFINFIYHDIRSRSDLIFRTPLLRYPKLGQHKEKSKVISIKMFLIVVKILNFVILVIEKATQFIKKVYILFEVFTE